MAKKGAPVSAVIHTTVKVENILEKRRIKLQKNEIFNFLSKIAAAVTIWPQVSILSSMKINLFLDYFFFQKYEY